MRQAFHNHFFGLALVKFPSSLAPTLNIVSRFAIHYSFFLDYNIRDFTLLTLMFPKFFTLLFLVSSPSVMHMLADTMGVVVAKDVDAQSPMTLPVSTMTIPGAIDCEVSSMIFFTSDSNNF